MKAVSKQKKGEFTEYIGKNVVVLTTTQNLIEGKLANENKYWLYISDGDKTVAVNKAFIITVSI